MKKENSKMLFGICFLTTFSALYSLTGVVIAYIANAYPDTPYTTVAQVLTLPSLIGTVVSFLIGPVAMRFDKKKLILAEQFCVLAAMMICLVVGSVNGPLWLLIVAACLDGISVGSNMTLLASLINERFDSSKSGTYLAMLTACIQGCNAIMATVAGTIAAGNGGADWYNAYYLGFLMIPAMLVFWKLVPGDERISREDAVKAGATASAGKEKESIPVSVILLMVARFLICVTLATYSYNYSSYIIREYQLGTSVEAGMVASCYQVVCMVVGFTYAFWNKLFKKHIALVGFLLQIAGLVCMMQFTTSMAGIFLAVLLIGLGTPLSSSSVMAMAMQWTPKRLAPIAAGMSMGFMTMGAYSCLYIEDFFAGFLGGGMKNQILVGIIIGVIATILLEVAISMNKKKQPA